MSDLEITILCAKALHDLIVWKNGLPWIGLPPTPFDPLHNGDQTFDLIETFHIVIIPGLRTPKGRAPWHAEIKSPDWEAFDPDLKRAIATAVAKMQQEKQR